MDPTDAIMDFAIDLMLAGFASSVVLVLFAAAPMRRVLMGFGLTCVVGILALSLVGPFRVVILLIIALYLLHGRFRDRQSAMEDSGGDTADVTAAAKAVEARPPGSFRHRPGCSDRLYSRPRR
ncbi:MAG: hypothetical protein HOK81_00365 [Rhodospirillaceae bacterium]|nr:hypothetical protein [Rhodospirillaceae bacterium]